MTWDPAYFKSTDLIVQIQVQMQPMIEADPDEAIMMEGWTSLSMKTSNGSYAWEVSQPNIFQYTDEELSGTLYLLFSESEGGPTTSIAGPQFKVLREATATATDSPEETSSTSPIGLGVHPAAIAVPVVAAVLAFILVGWLVWRKQRRAKANSPSFGDDIKYMREAPSVGSVPVGTNVFREEVQRQEEEKY